QLQFSSVSAGLPRPSCPDQVGVKRVGNTFGSPPRALGGESHKIFLQRCSNHPMLLPKGLRFDGPRSLDSSLPPLSAKSPPRPCGRLIHFHGRIIGRREPKRGSEPHSKCLCHPTHHSVDRSSATHSHRPRLLRIAPAGQ